ncbi:receptor-type tyrosine-protein phosphatase kappa [Plakobranchus ocellatus]|uniref:Receptor-type tyrosine-protein phosphatase kappa n=1 Tax=Plakobranchus ocellatus TaxID=259542 RepID=A0AAV4AAS8_9GAST|nr:receptor-type tyrosine-protein phosphatase kappa [Plakobranchus ocellatus]
MKMSKSLASYIGVKVAQLKVMCGLSVDPEAAGDKGMASVTPEPIASSKFLSVYRQRLKTKQLAVEFQAINNSCEDHSANAALRNVLLNIKQDVVTSSLQHGDIRLLGPPSGQGGGDGTRILDNTFPANLRANSLSTVPATPSFGFRDD